MSLRPLIALAFGITGVFACSSNDEPTGSFDAGSDTNAPSCALMGESCGACCPQYGHAYDEARDCLGGKSVIGCSPVPASTTACAYLGVVGCARTADGRAWFTADRAAEWSPAQACNDALSAKVQAAKPCATSDAATD